MMQEIILFHGQLHLVLLRYCLVLLPAQFLHEFVGQASDVFGLEFKLTHLHSVDVGLVQELVVGLDLK